jgi:hypothetical protein
MCSVRPACGGGWFADPAPPYPESPACRGLRGTPIMFSTLRAISFNLPSKLENLAARCLSLSADTI